MSQTHPLFPNPQEIPVVILCGGQGTRIREVSEVLPKPMIPIGEKPILWHIMKLYAHYGFQRFFLCLGYKGWLIKEFFLNYLSMISDFTIELGEKSTIEYHQKPDETHWKVTLVDTTERAQTGHRLWLMRDYLPKTGPFFLTYGDGVSNVDIRALLDAHLASQCVGTLTGVNMPSRFGELESQDGKVLAFQEKPTNAQSRINGGFMVLDGARIWDYLSPDPMLKFESEPLEKMVADGQLGIFEHQGYWQCMDTPREFDLLNALWSQNKAPWKVW